MTILQFTQIHIAKHAEGEVIYMKRVREMHNKLINRSGAAK